MQRNAEVAVWGWGQPEANVTVAFYGQKQSTTVTAKGKWSLKLAPMEALSVGSDFKVFSGPETLIFKMF